MTGSSSTPETAAAAIDRLADLIWPGIVPRIYQDCRARLAAALTAGGFTVVSGGEGLQHGAELDKRCSLATRERHSYGPCCDDSYNCFPVWVEERRAGASGAAPGTTAEPAKP